MYSIGAACGKSVLAPEPDVEIERELQLHRERERQSKQEMSCECGLHYLSHAYSGSPQHSIGFQRPSSQRCCHGSREECAQDETNHDPHNSKQLSDSSAWHHISKAAEKKDSQKKNGVATICSSLNQPTMTILIKIIL